MTHSKELRNQVTEAVKQFYRQPPLSSEQVKAHWTLAMEVREHLKPIREPLSAIETDTNMDVGGWLLDLPFTLANHGFVDEAVTLGASYAEITEGENFLGDRGIILAEAGRREEALAQLTENLLRFPDDPWVIIKGGDVHEALGEHDQAERLYRRALELAGDDDYARAGAVERLVPLLDNAGRKEEADALIHAEEAREDIRRNAWKNILDDKPEKQPSPLLDDIVNDPFAEEDDHDLFSVPYTRPLPKIGRNEPCPCGSGKKYKKCCLGQP